jgi:hypothetical protein
MKTLRAGGGENGWRTRQLKRLPPAAPPPAPRCPPPGPPVPAHVAAAPPPAPLVRCWWLRARPVLTAAHPPPPGPPVPAHVAAAPPPVPHVGRLRRPPVRPPLNTTRSPHASPPRTPPFTRGLLQSPPPPPVLHAATRRFDYAARARACRRANVCYLTVGDRWSPAGRGLLGV